MFRNHRNGVIDRYLVEGLISAMRDNLPQTVSIEEFDTIVAEEQQRSQDIKKQAIEWWLAKH
jgi:hypothetical protein